jgi:hypothetical protein
MYRFVVDCGAMKAALNGTIDQAANTLTLTEASGKTYVYERCPEPGCPSESPSGEY